MKENTTHPRQINIQRRHNSLIRVLSRKPHKTVVLDNQPLRRRHHTRTMQPVQFPHLLHKRSLAQHRANEIDTKVARIVPVVRQHFPDRNLTSLGHETWDFLPAVDHFESHWGAHDPFKLRFDRFDRKSTQLSAQLPDLEVLAELDTTVRKEGVVRGQLLASCCPCGHAPDVEYGAC